MYSVSTKKAVQKNVEKLPEIIQDKFAKLLSDLEVYGPIQKRWPNFSTLGKGKFHCHLSDKWVACWTYNKDTITIEVYYAGSRENAPY